MRETYFAYVDESGDTGSTSTTKGASHCYTLGCVLIKASDWSTSMETIVSLRRHLRDKLRIPVRSELKANYLVRGQGPLKRLELTPDQRQYAYRLHLHAVERMRAQAFSVVLDKREWHSQDRVFDHTWETLLQRLERTTRSNGHVVVIHDEGEDARIRRLWRRSRKFMTAGSAYGANRLKFSAEHFLEDPVSRDSSDSYFIQLADMVAYAGWRHYMPPSASVAKVVPQSTWGHLGAATLRKVNSHGGSGDGVVIRK